MDRVIDLTAIVQREVEDYSGDALKATTYPISDHQRRTYAVVVPDRPSPFPARIVNDFVVIDEDTTDRPLWEELARAGIPRERIICLYAGIAMPVQEP